MTIDQLKHRIEERMAVLGLNAFEVARRGGLERTYVSDFISGRKKSLRNDKIAALAKALETSSEWLMGLGTPSSATRSQTMDDRIPVSAESLIPGAELVGLRDLPVYVGAQGGDGHLIITFDAVDYVKRPEPLRNVKGGYGLLISGQSMVPAYRPGDIALVNPHLPPARETEVILYHTPPDGEAEAIIKTLVGFNDREWTLEQYNPAKTFTEFRIEWPICHRTVGKYSAR